MRIGAHTCLEQLVETLVSFGLVALLLSSVDWQARMYNLNGCHMLSGTAQQSEL